MSGNRRITVRRRIDPGIVVRMKQQRRDRDAAEEARCRTARVIIVGAGKTVARRDVAIVECIDRLRARDRGTLPGVEVAALRQRLALHVTEQPALVKRVARRPEAARRRREIERRRNRDRRGQARLPRPLAKIFEQHVAAERIGDGDDAPLPQRRRKRFEHRGKIFAAAGMIAIAAEWPR